MATLAMNSVVAPRMAVRAAPRKAAPARLGASFTGLVSSKGAVRGLFADETPAIAAAAAAFPARRGARAVVCMAKRSVSNLSRADLEGK